MGNPQTIWFNPLKKLVETIDQRYLPFQEIIVEIATLDEARFAITEMIVRGAPLIGVTAAYGMYLAAKNLPGNDFQAEMKRAADWLKSSRPTAVNLAFAVDEALTVISAENSMDENVQLLFNYAESLKNREIDFSKKIGENGLEIIRTIGKKKPGEPVQILTHCNAGRLACVELGTATAPIYLAHQAGIPVHVWVDETRPRNQGARLTAWELAEAGISHTVIPDNAGGHLMQHQMIDMVIVGSDRTTLNGDVANKIGTYLKALAAGDNGIPFYAALPSTTIDWTLSDGVAEIPIEQRDGREVFVMEGMLNGEVQEFRIIPEKSSVANYGFDVTPARLVTALITERGVCKASREGILSLFPEKNPVMTEGYIKFNCNWEQKEIRVPEEQFVVLNKVRSQLYELRLIGVYPDGIGFGNISVRNAGGKAFIITGSTTGQFAKLDQSHYSLVTGYSFGKNSVSCTGLTKASAESLTHAAVYEALPQVGAVVHIHSVLLWEKLLNKYPTTSETIEYGTPEMALAVKELAIVANSHFEKIIIMGGHREGILAFAGSLEEATSAIINIYNQYIHD